MTGFHNIDYRNSSFFPNMFVPLTCVLLRTTSRQGRCGFLRVPERRGESDGRLAEFVCFPFLATSATPLDAPSPLICLVSSHRGPSACTCQHFPPVLAVRRIEIFKIQDQVFSKNASGPHGVAWIPALALLDQARQLVLAFAQATNAGPRYGTDAGRSHNFRLGPSGPVQWPFLATHLRLRQGPFWHWC